MADGSVQELEGEALPDFHLHPSRRYGELPPVSDRVVEQQKIEEVDGDIRDQQRFHDGREHRDAVAAQWCLIPIKISHGEGWYHGELAPARAGRKNS